MEQKGANGVNAGAIDDVRTGVSQNGNDPVGDEASFAGQIVRLTVHRFDERGQADGFVGEIGTAENLGDHVPVEPISHVALSAVVLGA